MRFRVQDERGTVLRTADYTKALRRHVKLLAQGGSSCLFDTERERTISDSNAPAPSGPLRIANMTSNEEQSE